MELGFIFRGVYAGSAVGHTKDGEAYYSILLTEGTNAYRMYVQEGVYNRIKNWSLGTTCEAVINVYAKDNRLRISAYDVVPVTE